MIWKKTIAGWPRECDQPIGALLADLKQRGMLEETLVIWGGEFGRTPTVELPTPGANAGKINGRDHNHHGFTHVAGRRRRAGGYVHGATDEFGFKAVENRSTSMISTRPCCGCWASTTPN